MVLRILISSGDIPNSIMLAPPRTTPQPSQNLVERWWNPGQTSWWNLTSGPPGPPRSLSLLRPQSFQLLGKKDMPNSTTRRRHDHLKMGSLPGLGPFFGVETPGSDFCLVRCPRMRIPRNWLANGTPSSSPTAWSDSDRWTGQMDSTPGREAPRFGEIFSVPQTTCDGCSASEKWSLNRR